MRDDPLTYGFVTGSDAGLMILKLNGPLTLTNMFGLQQELRAMQPSSLILDLSGVPYMDSAGLGLVMNAYVSAESHGKKLVLAGVNERVAALLEMTKVDTILKSFATVQEAEAGMRRGVSR